MARRSNRRPRSLRRRRHVTEPQRRFLIYCEGTETEPSYFQAIRERYINTQIEPIGVGGVARTVAQQAITCAKDLRSQRRRRASRSPSYQESDQVWAVFDHDEHPDIQDAMATCRDNSVEVADSNPCFELWLVLHIEDYDKPATPPDIQSHLHALYPEYHHQRLPGPGFSQLVAELDAAERRAARQLQFRQQEQNAGGNPSTTVGCLTQAIRIAHEASRRP